MLPHAWKSSRVPIRKNEKPQEYYAESKVPVCGNDPPGELFKEMDCFLRSRAGTFERTAAFDMHRPQIVCRVVRALSFQVPVVPARGGAEVALNIYIYKTFLIYRTCMRRAPAKPVRACTLRKRCPVSHVTFEAPRHTSHLTVFTLHTALFTLHPSQSTLHFTPVLLRLHTSHFTLHTAHFTLHSPHFTLLTSHCFLHTPHFTLHTSHCTLHAPHFTLHSSHSTLHLI